MPDSRFKNSEGYCKLCHKLCFDSELKAIIFMADHPDLKLTYAYTCSLYPSGYWHVTSTNKMYKARPWKVEVLKLKPERSRRIFDRIKSILDQPQQD